MTGVCAVFVSIDDDDDDDDYINNDIYLDFYSVTLLLMLLFCYCVA